MDSIVQGFNILRAEQRQLSSKVAELDQDLTEHKLVSEALSQVDSSRTCFRMVGGVLVERTVAEVLPSLQRNKQIIETLIESLNKQIVIKGTEIQTYVQKHNIQMRANNESKEDNSNSLSSDCNSVLVE